MIAFICVFPTSWQYHLLGSFPNGEFSPYRKHILPWIPPHERLSLYPRKSTCLALPQQWVSTAQNTVGFFLIPEMVLFWDFPKQSTRPNFQNSKSRYFHGIFSPRVTFLVFTIFLLHCALLEEQGWTSWQISDIWLMYCIYKNTGWDIFPNSSPEMQGSHYNSAQSQKHILCRYLPRNIQVTD
jgi:hypothetical protein